MVLQIPPQLLCTKDYYEGSHLIHYCAAIVRELPRTAKGRENVGTGSTNSLKYLMETVSQHSIKSSSVNS